MSSERAETIARGLRIVAEGLRVIADGLEHGRVTSDSKSSKNPRANVGLGRGVVVPSEAAKRKAAARLRALGLDLGEGDD